MHLIKRGADVNAHTIDSWSPLLKATQKHFHDILLRLIEKGANLQHKLPNANTALHIACEIGDLEAAKILINHGFKEINYANKDKETPLMIAER